MQEKNIFNKQAELLQIVWLFFEENHVSHERAQRLTLFMCIHLMHFVSTRHWRITCMYRYSRWCVKDGFSFGDHHLIFFGFSALLVSFKRKKLFACHLGSAEVLLKDCRLAVNTGKNFEMTTLNSNKKKSWQGNSVVCSLFFNIGFWIICKSQFITPKIAWRSTYVFPEIITFVCTPTNIILCVAFIVQ